MKASPVDRDTRRKVFAARKRMSIGEAANVLGVERSFIGELISEGELRVSWSYNGHGGQDPYLFAADVEELAGP